MDMNHHVIRGRSPWALVASAFFVTLAVAVTYGCDVGGKEGDRCNPPVLQDECDDGLSCKPASCAESFCCPTDGRSASPSCNAVGCEADASTDAELADASDAAPNADSVAPDAAASVDASPGLDPDAAMRDDADARD